MTPTTLIIVMVAEENLISERGEPKQTIDLVSNKGKMIRGTLK